MVEYFLTEKAIEESLQDDVRAVITIEGDKIYTRQMNLVWDGVQKLTEHADIDHRIITDMAQKNQSYNNCSFNEAYHDTTCFLLNLKEDEMRTEMKRKLAILKAKLKRLDDE